MNQGFLEYGLPTLIALVFVNFVWAWIVAAAKPPGGSEDEPLSSEGHPDWKYLEDGGPEGVRKSLSEEIRPKTKVPG